MEESSAVQATGVLIVTSFPSHKIDDLNSDVCADEPFEGRKFFFFFFFFFCFF
jgi:hypothetical protein